MTAHTIKGRKKPLARTPHTCLVSSCLSLFPGFLSELVHEAGPEIAILKSSDLKAYNEAVEGFNATAPGDATYIEYDLRGDLERGKQLARKIRGTNSSLVVAVGLKAALAAKFKIVDIPILYMMILDPDEISAHCCQYDWRPPGHSG